MKQRALRLALSLALAAGSLMGYAATAPAAHADDSITLTLNLTIVCNSNPSYMGYGPRGLCDATTAVSTDGSFVGFSAPFPADYLCQWSAGTLQGDSLVGTACYTTADGVTQIGITGGTGRFAGYTAPPTPQPLFKVTGAGVPDNPVCGWRAPIAQCPWAEIGTGVVTLTLTKPAP
ncbi:MAG: hypothetical protein JOZ68_15155 [Acidimicrobiia bacterium]|nr:hypothetical protein [Acidimicrobiia bacterium]MBV8985339.1 hypothetical protein [Acidimicrobiia bacterium]MBV9042342.1 hypothetical protein [Acidimicrobiia bacterium]